MPLNLWDPFGLPGGPSSQTDEQKKRGLNVEVNNGRLAMIGIFSLMSESVTPGSVPGLTILDSIIEPFGLGIQPYADEWPLNIARTWGDFDIFSSLPYWQ